MIYQKLCQRCGGDGYINIDNDVQCVQCGRYLMYHTLTKLELSGTSRPLPQSTFRFQ